MKARFPHPGELFEDKYRVEAILGSGGFARVYRAVEEGLDRKVALKILRPRIDDEQSDSQRDSYLETVMQRFRREARLLSQLRSANTITMHHYGKTEEGLLYMVLEYIDGLSLAELMRAGKPLPPKRVATILEQVLNSLQEAHVMGMLHRDLKPANVMIYEHLGNRDNVKLLDFGIAKLVKDANIDKDLTGDGTLVGTPRYMAPEQIRGEEEVGPGADIYSLGLVGYELLVGERAIEADSSIKIIGRQLAPESFFLPIDIDCPPRLRHVIDRMLQKNTELRYDNAADVIAALKDPDLLSEEIEDLDAFVLDPIDDIIAEGEAEAASANGLSTDDDGFEELDLNDPSIEELDPDSLEVAKASYLASPDVSVEEPLPGTIDPSESIDTSFTGLNSDGRRPLILAGAVFLVIVLSLLGLVFIGGDDQQTEVLAETNEKSVDTDAGDDASALAAKDSADAGTNDPLEGTLDIEVGDLEPDAEEPRKTLVKANHDEVEVFVDGELVGIAPVEIDGGRFPARIEAKHKGRTRALSLDSPSTEITFEFPEYREPKKPADRPRKSKPKKPEYQAIPYH